MNLHDYPTTSEWAYQTMKKMKQSGATYKDWLLEFGKPDEKQWKHIYEDFRKWA
jgi:hypothetical protein